MAGGVADAAGIVERDASDILVEQYEYAQYDGASQTKPGMEVSYRRPCPLSLVDQSLVALQLLQVLAVWLSPVWL